MKIQHFIVTFLQRMPGLHQHVPRSGFAFCNTAQVVTIYIGERDNGPSHIKEEQKAAVRPDTETVQGSSYVILDGRLKSLNKLLSAIVSRICMFFFFK